MASRHAVVNVPQATWTQLTNGNALGDLTVVLQNSQLVYINATTSGSAPSTVAGGIFLYAGDGWSEATIAEKFPGAGISTAAHLWAYCSKSAVDFFISHADVTS